jgi:hypothetical protein
MWQDTNVSEVHAASIFRVKIQVEVFWVVALCSFVVAYQRFGGQRCLLVKMEAHSITTQQT